MVYSLGLYRLSVGKSWDPLSLQYTTNTSPDSTQIRYQQWPTACCLDNKHFKEEFFINKRHKQDVIEEISLLHWWRYLHLRDKNCLVVWFLRSPISVSSFSRIMFLLLKSTNIMTSLCGSTSIKSSSFLTNTWKYIYWSWHFFSLKQIHLVHYPSKI